MERFFLLNLCVYGHNVYKTIWSPHIGKNAVVPTGIREHSGLITLSYCHWRRRCNWLCPTKNSAICHLDQVFSSMYLIQWWMCPFSNLCVSKFCELPCTSRSLWNLLQQKETCYTVHFWWKVAYKNVQCLWKVAYKDIQCWWKAKVKECMIFVEYKNV